MNYNKLTLIIVGVIIGAIGAFFIHPAAAYACGSGGNIAYGRRAFCGYFDNNSDNTGNNVLDQPFPGSVNRVNNLISYLEGSNGLNGNRQDTTGAEFIIHTMMNDQGGVSRNVSNSELSLWEASIRAFGSISENGTKSVGPSGYILWDQRHTLTCGSINSFYQVSQNDDAFYVDSGSAQPPCGGRQDFIQFFDNNNRLLYELKRDCANPIGDHSGIPHPPPPSTNLTPSVSVTITDASGNPVSGLYAQAGDKLTFHYSVFNTGPTASPGGLSCTRYTPNPVVGYQPVPTPPTYNVPPGTPTTPAPGCPGGSIPVNATANLTNEGPLTITAAEQSTSICRSLSIVPADQNGSTKGAEACAYVAAEPYVKVFGGDVSAGKGFASGGSCTPFNSASIFSWNTNNPNYQGAGSQYAAYALNEIYGFGTAQSGNAGATAATPSGLAFANSTITGPQRRSGTFGQGYGWDQTCITDYVATQPSSAVGLPPSGGGGGAGATDQLNNLSTLGSNAYYDVPPSGTLTINGGGNIGAGTRIQLFVKGNVVITGGDVNYSGQWSSDHIPLFELVSNGNLYIDPSVKNLAGVYIAEGAPTSGQGLIYTCTTVPWSTGDPHLTADPTAANFYTNCNQQLLINGAFVANELYLLRTAGTLSSSGTDSPSNLQSSAAEQFNFNPTLWIAQPPGSGLGLQPASSITNLPPVL